MNVQLKIPTKKSDNFEIYGFSIPMTPNGRRIWPPRFKKYIAIGIAERKFTASEVAVKCKVSVSLIHQWKKEVENPSNKFDQHDKNAKPETILGFEVSKTNDGRRNWPIELKQCVLDKLKSKTASAKELARICDVDSSVIYQWKQEVIGKASKAKNNVRFSELIIEEISSDLGGKHIIFKLQQSELHLPYNYPVENLVTLIRVVNT